MANFNINAVKRRVVLSGSAGTGPYAFTFEILDQNDISVFKDTTKLTLTADYTVSINANGTGSVTLGVAATGSNNITIIGARDIERTTDFVTAGDLKASSLNEQLDALTIFDQQINERVDRAVISPVDDPQDIDMTLPTKSARVGKYLAFNATTGQPEAGPSTSNVNSLAAITDDIATLADIEDGTTATDAISGLAAIKANVTTVAGISSNVTTVAGISSNVTAVAGDASDIGTVASNISSVNTNATNISAIQGAAANASTATTKASEAASSATAAAASATTATTQASTATTQASTSTTKAGEAATSATASATSATASATSATASASSATAAAASQTAAAASASSAASAFDNFDDTYLGSKTSNPTVDNDGDALVAGALYFNSTANEMRVYDGANWIAATSAGNVSLILYEYTATNGQTTFTGSDDNSASLSYTVDNIQVVMNGVILDPSDFTATNGTSVVLASGAATNDLINIYAYKSFTTADMVSASAGGTFAGNVDITARLDVDNLRLDGNTISSTDTNGNVNIDPAGTGNTVIASGRVGIGTSAPSSYSGTLAVVDSAVGSVAISGGTGGNEGSILRFQKGTTDKAFIGMNSVVQGGGSSSDGLTIENITNSPTRFRNDGSESLRIESSSSMIGRTSTSLSGTGVLLVKNSTNFMGADASNILALNRNNNDGDLMQFRQADNIEGSISVSGSTVSYNGGHLARWSQLADNTKDTSIVKGTVMTNLDQMAVWHHEAQPATYYTEDDELPDGVSVGDEKTPAVAAYDEDNEQLNCMAVSSVEGDANVAGVFVNWDDDDTDFTADMNVAMTGDMVIRIASGTTVARGDLLMSAGDGTAKPQGDDIVRSKTIAKVTSTTVSHTYDDGTFLVPCVLMAC